MALHCLSVSNMAAVEEVALGPALCRAIKVAVPVAMAPVEMAPVETAPVASRII